MTTAIETKTTVDAIVSETNANEKNEMVQYDVISYLSCKCGYKAVVPAGNRFNRKCPDCKAWLNVRLNPNHENYVKGLNVTVNGNDTYDINDLTAVALRGMDIKDAYIKAAELMMIEIPRESWFSPKMDREYRKSGKSLAEFLSSRWSERNLGMQRMNLGNVLRAAFNRAL